MIRFLLKGLFRDRSRSLLSFLVITLGVMLTVLLHSWISGVLGDMIDYNARFSTGHVKIMTRAYAGNMDQVPNDLALMGVAKLIDGLKRDFPDMHWVKRIRFGGLLDVPDKDGETRAQGPAIGLAVDLLSEGSTEIVRLNIEKALIRGNMPRKPGEILISEEFALKLGVKPGETVTLLSATMHGSMAMHNFTLAGTVVFGIGAMDKSAMLMDVSDAQLALDMQDASGEILGYFNNIFYDDARARSLAEQFNANYSDQGDEFSPIMVRLAEQNELGGMMEYTTRMIGIFISIFLGAMSIILWNAGLIGGLRRYGEVGVRLAIGEDKGHIYRSMIYESVLIGILASLAGTFVGLVIAYILQAVGIDFGAIMKNVTMIFPTVFRTRVTPTAYYIGFLPGLLATVLGTMLAGIGIYKRNTAQLFKELEA
ncbi:ABC transporter permease [Thermodesulfobacteriota bacterium]